MVECVKDFFTIFMEGIDALNWHMNFKNPEGQKVCWMKVLQVHDLPFCIALENCLAMQMAREDLAVESAKPMTVLNYLTYNVRCMSWLGHKY